MTGTPEDVYTAAATAAWDAPGTRRLWLGEQRETYVALMVARPDFRALVDAVYRLGYGAGRGGGGALGYVHTAPDGTRLVLAPDEIAIVYPGSGVDR